MKYDLPLRSPWMNAAGSLGYSPDQHGPLDLSSLGIFVTNPISLEPRSPARGERFRAFPGGFLLHTGYPNPGLRNAIRTYAPRWARSSLPVLVHLLARQPGEVEQMVRRLEGREGVAGVEVGLPPESGLELAAAFAEAASGELPVVIRLPLERALELGQVCVERGAAAVSLGAPRGALAGTGGSLASGRLYGPAVLPLALAAVAALTNAHIPVIGAGGVYRPADAQAMLSAGAMAVQLDAVLWGWQMPIP
jgi:dihydroorotate dehydrogenase (NAD+) catalytic subunit